VGVRKARSDDAALESLLERLGDSDPAARAVAADGLSDYFRGRVGDDAAAAAVVGRLVVVAVVDGEEAV
jgi:HEAT repeat protein